MKQLLLASTLMFSTSLFAAPAPSVPGSEILGSFTVEEVSASRYKSFNRLKNNAYGYNGITGGFAGGGGENPYNGGQTGGQNGNGQNGNGQNGNGQNGNGYNGGGYGGGGYGAGGYGGGGYGAGGYGGGYGDPIETAGRVISTARDVVALGEAIYELVSKGKPHNVTEYAPISVVPKDPDTKEPVDIFDLEGFSFPVEKNYIAKITDGTGREAVKFSYKVMYSYGGSYNGKGKYLSNVIIIPGSIVTKYGWDFSAFMKLSGVMNHGTRENPVAGIMVTIKYQMNSWSRAYERNDTIHISGNGELKSYMTE